MAQDRLTAAAAFGTATAAAAARNSGSSAPFLQRAPRYCGSFGTAAAVLSAGAALDTPLDGTAGAGAAASPVVRPEACPVAELAARPGAAGWPPPPPSLLPPFGVPLLLCDAIAAGALLTELELLA